MTPELYQWARVSPISARTTVLISLKRTIYTSTIAALVEASGGFVERQSAGIVVARITPPMLFDLDQHPDVRSIHEVRCNLRT